MHAEVHSTCLGQVKPLDREKGTMLREGTMLGD